MRLLDPRRRRRAPGSESAGYHYDASDPSWHGTTPVVAPSPSQAARGPAGDYAGAQHEFDQAVAGLPPEARAVTLAAAPHPRPPLSTAHSLPPVLSSLLGLDIGADGTVPSPLVVPPALEKKTVGSPSLQEIIDSLKEGVYHPGGDPRTFAKFDPATGQLQMGADTGGVGVNHAGRITTPGVRSALHGLRGAQRRFQQTALPDTSGLSPEELRILPYALRAHRKYPDIPVSVLMAQDKQESGFDPNAISSAGAQGVSQFIPETAATYGVQYGDTPHAIQSQVTGQAHLLHDEGFASDPQGALSSYSGGYAAGDYNNPILTDAQASYSALDRPSRAPRPVRRRLQAAQQQARELGLPTHLPGAGSPSVAGPPQGPQRIPSVVYIGNKAEHKFGLDVGENPAFGGVDPVHVEGSYHYQRDKKGRGEAIDVTGDPSQLMAFDEWAARKWGKGLTELFYDPGVSIKEGEEIGSIGGHGDHVHVAVGRPGSTFEGGYAGGVGGATPVGSTAASLIASGAPPALVGQAVSQAQAPSVIPISQIQAPLAPEVPLPEGFIESPSSGGPENDQGQSGLLDLLSQIYAPAPLVGARRSRRSRG